MEGQKITATEFFEAFQEEWALLCAQELITGLTPFEEKAAWTRKMLQPEGFLHRVMRRLIQESRNLEYRMEWYSVDALYVGGADIYGKNLTYPSEVYALIEHEFDEDLETEMWKLIHWRAPLKVIISYDWAENEKSTDARKTYLTRKISKLNSMLAAVNTFHAEHKDTEYLYIMATREKHDGEILWRRIEDFSHATRSLATSESRPNFE